MMLTTTHSVALATTRDAIAAFGAGYNAIFLPVERRIARYLRQERLLAVGGFHLTGHNEDDESSIEDDAELTRSSDSLPKEHARTQPARVPPAARYTDPVVTAPVPKETVRAPAPKKSAYEEEALKETKTAADTQWSNFQYEVMGNYKKKDSRSFWSVLLRRDGTCEIPTECFKGLGNDGSVPPPDMFKAICKTCPLCTCRR